MSLPVIFVTGANGQLGSELRDRQSELTGWDMRFFDRAGFPVEDKDVTEQLFQEHRPTVFINCAAYTAVDKAESEPEVADEVNGYAPGRVAALCEKYGTQFIHISTDYVFNGRATAPLKEDDSVDPVNRYGAGKLLGEQLTMKNNPSAIIIRTSWVYSVYGKNFVKTMRKLMSERESIGVVADQFGSPTYAADLADAIVTMVKARKRTPGIFHYSNSGIISWHQFAEAIRDLSGFKCEVKPITTDQFPTPAKRPAYSGMDTSKIGSAYGIHPPAWKDSLRICIEKLEKV